MEAEAEAVEAEAEAEALGWKRKRKRLKNNRFHTPDIKNVNSYFTKRTKQLSQ